MKAVDSAIALVFGIASAGVTAFVMAAFLHYGLDVPPAVLRFDALICAGLLSLLLLAVALIKRKQN
jgi:hypothetical protein